MIDERLQKTLDGIAAILESRNAGDTDIFDVIKTMAKRRGTSVMDCICCMLSLKLSRLECGVSEADSLADIAGYAVLGLTWLNRERRTNMEATHAPLRQMR